MEAGILSGVVTAVALLAFLGGTAWAYSSARKPEFDAAARLPLDESENKS